MATLLNIDDGLKTRVQQEALASRKACQETGPHLTVTEVGNWLSTWGTDDEQAAPECHKSSSRKARSKAWSGAVASWQPRHRKQPNAPAGPSSGNSSGWRSRQTLGAPPPNGRSFKRCWWRFTVPAMLPCNATTQPPVPCISKSLGI